MPSGDCGWLGPGTGLRPSSSLLKPSGPRGLYSHIATAHSCTAVRAADRMRAAFSRWATVKSSSAIGRAASNRSRPTVFTHCPTRLVRLAARTDHAPVSMFSRLPPHRNRASAGVLGRAFPASSAQLCCARRFRVVLATVAARGENVGSPLHWHRA
jgi:hypothetical protein